jgi:type II secretory pathway component GspD/PulD (secretin)
MTFKPHRIHTIVPTGKYLQILMVAALLLLSSAQAGSLTTIQLHNRPAEEIIPVINPMLGAGDVITGQGYKIFLRSSPQTLEDVRQMVDALDVANKMLLISVSQGSERDFKATAVSGAVKVESGNSSIGVGSQTGDAAGSIDYSRGNTNIGVEASSTSSQRNSKPVHHLRVAEGTEGFIETGEQIPYFSGVSGHSAATTEFKSVTTGFYVLPRIQGSQVTLQVSPFKNSRADGRSGSIDTQQARTTVTGALGEWLQIGGVSEQFQSSQTGIASHRSASGSSEDSIWIKAELLQ